MALGHFDTLTDDVFDFVHCLAHRLWIGGGNESMQWFILARQRLAILSAHFALLHRSLAANYDLGARILLHSLERVASRPDEQAHKIDVRVLLLWNQHFVADTSDWRSKETIIQLDVVPNNANGEL